jgi:hypothetical protein
MAPPFVAVQAADGAAMASLLEQKAMATTAAAINRFKPNGARLDTWNAPVHLGGIHPTSSPAGDFALG